ncbi:hypothetical protein [Polyangium fumosum]|uniref:Uncharacterized protein n=1 Tax=Polyangium fumosum TaxID=889272 RepID=A0A4U1J8L2_9BACT|nr:hypothetical protein [Polyangium fumosum]TKD03950.1 hypothetical protein E8A74_24155 [Polyangium fumosum]
MAVKSRADLFRTNESEPKHPRLRRWKKLRESGYHLDLEIHREWDGLTFSPAKMFVTLRKHEEDPGILEELLWEDALNQGLVELGIPASTPEGEVMRYALAFKTALEPVSLRHNEDFLRSVLVEFLRAGDVFPSHPELMKMLDQVHPAQAYRGASYDQALEAVESIINAKAEELESKLRYPQEKAFDILCRALAQYLDEIFHVTARRFWFPK